MDGTGQFHFKHSDGRTQEQVPEGTTYPGVIALADVIRNNGAMTKFDISSNVIRAEGGKALAAALKGNQVIMELNISSNMLSLNGDTSGVIAIANAIPDMRALTSLNLSGNGLGAEGAEHIAEAIKVSRCVVAAILHHFHAHLVTG
jgi:Ran GTPase-activating protein (RanGAP) involved in mRNA processing and transport